MEHSILAQKLFGKKVSEEDLAKNILENSVLAQRIMKNSVIAKSLFSGASEEDLKIADFINAAISIPKNLLDSSSEEELFDMMMEQALEAKYNWKVHSKANNSNKGNSTQNQTQE